LSDRRPAKPVLCVVQDDGEVRRLLERDLRERFGGQYDIESYADAPSAVRALERHAADERRVAVVFVADTDASGGAEFRTRVRDVHPHVRRVLLVGRGEWKNAHPAVEAMRTGQAESYVFIPWVSRERWLYLPVTETLADWEASQRPATEVARIVGGEWDPRSHELRDVFWRIGVPFGFYPPSSAEGAALLTEASLGAERLPVLAFPRTGTFLVDPSYERIAQALGFATDPGEAQCDLAIVGGGPAGLAAVAAGGRARLTSLVLRDNATGTTAEVAADALHVMIGAQPHTEWLDGAVARDEQGCIVTGPDLTARDAAWPLERPPMLLETSLPGVFVAGDVRHGAVKRVASPVGAGSIAVQLAHVRLAELA